MVIYVYISMIKIVKNGREERERPREGNSGNQSDNKVIQKEKLNVKKVNASTFQFE